MTIDLSAEVRESDLPKGFSMLNPSLDEVLDGKMDDDFNFDPVGTNPILGVQSYYGLSNRGGSFPKSYRVDSRATPVGATDIYAFNAAGK